MQQQVQKVLAKKKQEPLLINADKAADNINNSKIRIAFAIQQLMRPLPADYRGHTIRMKRWLPEIEQKIKYAFSVIKNENEAMQYLLNLGLTTHEIDLVLQHFLTNAELNMRKQAHQRDVQPRKPLSVQEQQLELIGFSQNVRVLLPVCWP